MEELLNLRDQLVILAAGPRRGAEELVSAIREDGSTADVLMLLGPLAHEQRLDQLASVTQQELFGMVHEAIGKEMIRRRSNGTVAASEQEALRRPNKITGRHDLMGCFGACPFGLRGIVEQQGDAAVAFEEREPLPFDDAEVARITQEVRVPIITVKKQPVDIRSRQAPAQIFDPRTISGRNRESIGTCHDTNP